MLLKLGVDISRLNRNIRRALIVCDNIYTARNLECVLTSTYEGNHSPGSLHYCNDAFDIRRPGKKDADITTSIKLQLGAHFDVVSETDHVHIEYDPKK